MMKTLRTMVLSLLFLVTPILSEVNLPLQAELMVAISESNPDRVLELIKAGAQVNVALNKPPLLLALEMVNKYQKQSLFKEGTLTALGGFAASAITLSGLKTAFNFISRARGLSDGQKPPQSQSSDSATWSEFFSKEGGLLSITGSALFYLLVIAGSGAGFYKLAKSIHRLINNKFRSRAVIGILKAADVVIDSKSAEFSRQNDLDAVLYANTREKIAGIGIENK